MRPLLPLSAATHTVVALDSCCIAALFSPRITCTITLSGSANDNTQTQDTANNRQPYQREMNAMHACEYVVVGSTKRRRQRETT